MVYDGYEGWKGRSTGDKAYRKLIRTFTLFPDNFGLMQSQPANLEEKTNRYMVMLEEALKDVKTSVGEGSYLRKIADDYLDMARSYYNDGVHFVENEDRVNALVCFSYGHAWLDAGVRLGVFTVKNQELFAI